MIILRPTFHRRLAHSTSSLLSHNKHTPDSYAKDVDLTPPSDSTIHRIDPNSEQVQKPHEPPSGPWSKAGVQASEYQTLSKSGNNQGKEQYAQKTEPKISHPGDGPEGKENAGRNSDGR